jgi:protocatechuate 3,4-dioxygenase beta subunit
MMLRRLSRRTMIALAGAQAALFTTGAHAAVATPRQSAGRFFPPPNRRPAARDWDLVKVPGRVRRAGGEVLHLFGQVLDIDGAPIPDALVEIWECDADRRRPCRDHGASRTEGADFQGIGATRTDSQGAYRFRTLRPRAQPGRTPHIHARVAPRTGRSLITQIYLLNEPQNAQDGIFRSLGAARQAAVTIDPVTRLDGDLEAGFNFIL